MNTLLDTKLAATSRKKNTTRMEILGVLNHKRTQIAFYDTPGFLRLDGPDSPKLRTAAFDAAAKADIILLMVDAAHPFTPVYQDLLADLIKLALAKAKMEIVLILNKVDLVEPKHRLLEATHDIVSLINGIKLGPENIKDACLDTTTFMISALHDDGIKDLKSYLFSLAVPRQWVIPDSAGITDLSVEERVEQVVLENLLDNVHEEVPYIAEIVCKGVSPLASNRLRVDVDILVDTAGQQRIVVGHQGRTLVKIRQASVDILQKIFEKQVILYLWVNTKGREELKS